MGCFFACFRIKTGPRTPLSSLETTPCKRRDHSFAKNQLASLLLSDDDNDLYEFGVGGDNVDRDLKHEAKLLKACGALLQTPAEIKNGPCKTDFQTRGEDDQLDTSPKKKLQYDEQPDQISNSPASTPYDDYSSHSIEPRCAVAQKGNESPSSNVIEGGGGQESNSAAPASKHLSSQSGRQVPVHVSKDSPFPTPLKLADGMVPVHVSKDSPYPTPLKLTDGMETPGTFYPTTLETPRGYGKNYRIRSQYVFAIQNQAKDPSEQLERCSSSDNGLELERLHSPTSCDADSGFSQPNAPVNCTDVKDFPVDGVSGKGSWKPTVVDTSDDCSHSLNDPHSGIIKQGDLSPGSTTPMVSIATKQISPVSKSPEMDRPIIGIVAAHWNDEEITTRISPKMWDGNGIPNSTNKYKEDQRVSWHATPFEERLEKALSDEKLFPQRKLLNGKPIEFDEEDEVIDTAAS